jgi:hypothetical protein
VTRVSPHRDVVFDVKGKQALLLSRLGTSVLRVSYPELKILGPTRLERGVYRVAGDEKRDKLYALRSDRPVSPTARGPADPENPELLVYDLKVFRGAARSPTPAAVAGRHRLGGAVRAMLLSPGGESLFYLDTKGKRVVKLDTAAPAKPAAELRLDVQPEAMAMSPDGKTLVVAGETSLVRIDPGALKQGAVTAVKFRPAAVAVNDRGQVAAAGAEAGKHWAALFEPGRAAPARGETRPGPVSVAMSADQKWVFVVPHDSGWAAVWRAADSAAFAPVSFRVEGLTSKLAPGGDFAVCPDGQRLILSGGPVVKLPAAVTGAR